jgi:SAM-dependent methyltransferase
MSRVSAKYHTPPAARRGRSAVTTELPVDAAGRALDYLGRNRAAWERWAHEYAAAGRAAWRDEELRWGIWALPEEELQLLGDVGPDADVVELGSGTAAVSAWLARKGMRPIAVDFARAQIETAQRLQLEFDISFSLVCENAEDLSFDDASFDLAVSEYGPSIWCDPARWLPEAHRLLRPGGRLVFFTNGALLMACTAEDGGPADMELVRDYFSTYRVEFTADGPVEFHPTHGEWIRLLRASGFTIEDLIEVRPPDVAAPRFDFVSVEWAQRWPSEEIWVARKPPKRQATARARRAQGRRARATA